MPKKMTTEELDNKAALNVTTRKRYLKYKEVTGCSNVAFALKVGFSRCIFQNWLAEKFDFSVGACESIQFVIGHVHDELKEINM
ncbi:hypothetical protein [Bacillus mycoides]|uniref:hypothetical protein n=1 Tax=Bacillus mycoides TaxID=1405 RepID=UPI0011A94C51|nr:hypothetical protein [Bacillus mycoides]